MRASVTARPLRMRRTPTPGILDVLGVLRAIAAVLAVAALAVGLWWVGQRAAHFVASALAEDPVVINTPVPGTRTLDLPLAVVAVIDTSASMQSSDPSGRRYVEARAFARWLGDYSENPDDRIGSVHFGSYAGQGLPPVPVAGNLTLIDSALSRPATDLGGGTNIDAGLDAAGALLVGLEGYRRVVILFSDGQSDLVTAAAALVRLPADSVWMVAFDVDGSYRASVAPFWEHAGLEGIIEVGSVDRGTISDALARIVTIETGQHWTPASTPSP